jgi:hypothetical protein
MSPSERLVAELARSLWVQCYADACEDEDRDLPPGVEPAMPGPQQNWCDFAPPVSAVFREAVLKTVEVFLRASVGTASGDEMAVSLAVLFPHYSKGGDIEAFAWNLGYDMTGSGGADWAWGPPPGVPSREHLHGYFNESGEFYVE